MNMKKCPPLAAAIVGFILGSIAMKLMARFCPWRCCCGGGEACCCGEESGEPGEVGCCGQAAESSSDEEADAPAE